MIKFFRKIRQRLLKENKLRSYLIYAIGEIVLVVIGILIALQINNWNQERLQDKILKNIHVILIEDLKNDISEVDRILHNKLSREHLLNDAIDGLLIEEDYLTNDTCLFLIIGGESPTIEQRGYQLLSAYNNSDKGADSLTNEIVKFYTRQLTDLYVDDNIRERDIERNINYWSDNYSWYAGYISDRNMDGFIDYALTNPDYKNRVANYYLLNYSVYIPKLITFRNEAKAILAQLEVKLDEE